MQRTMNPEEALKLREEGMSYKEIAEKLGFHPQTVAAAVKKIRKSHPEEKKMRETSRALCKSCRYGLGSSNGTIVTCDYYYQTGHRRGCPVGSCDKYEQK